MAIKSEAKIEKEVELIENEPKKKSAKKAKTKGGNEASLKRVMELKRELLNKQLELANGNSKDTASLRKIRKQIARMLMQLNLEANK